MSLCKHIPVTCCVCSPGRDETMQPTKPSFMEFFEQKEEEAKSHNDAGGRGDNNADNRRRPADGDLEVVSYRTRVAT